jgi:hypothetical protein
MYLHIWDQVWPEKPLILLAGPPDNNTQPETWADRIIDVVTIKHICKH